MPHSTEICIVLIGFTAGWLSSVAAGSTIFAFPMLVLLGLPPIIANATTSLGQLPAFIGSMAGYRRHLQATKPWLRFFIPVSLVGGLIGGVLLTWTPSRVFDQMVPFLILFATLLFMFQGTVARLTHSSPISIKLSKTSLQTRLILIVLQLLISIYGGYYGGGVGILLLCYFGFFDFANIHEMNTVKVVLVFAMNVVAVVYFAFYGLIHWPTAGLLCFGAFIGGWAGSHMAHRMPLFITRGFIIITGLASAAQLFYWLWK